MIIDNSYCCQLKCVCLCVCLCLPPLERPSPSSDPLCNPPESKRPKTDSPQPKGSGAPESESDPAPAPAHGEPSKGWVQQLTPGPVYLKLPHRLNNATIHPLSGALVSTCAPIET